MSRFRAFVLVFVLAAVAAGTGASEDARDARRGAKQLFDQLKGLAGTWEAKGMGAVSYRLTAGGTALVETLFAGTAKEMMTVYHLDGDDLVLTHYCAVGNQPRMKAASGTRNRISFEYAGGTNHDVATDTHMHALTIEFVDGDHVVATWTMWAKGEAAQAVTLDMTRTK
jgi:hypothetical protein